MSKFSKVTSHASSGTSTRNYYSSMNQALYRLNEEYTMLHYPYYRSDKDTFLEAQGNLTDYCMSKLPPVKNRTLLEVGCGNGVQAMYIMEKYAPGLIKGIDLNDGNIEIARSEVEKKEIKGVIFKVDDAHKLTSVEDNSIDFLINIESAFHYPDKPAFLHQVNRVLKPGGTFVIADILTRKTKRKSLKGNWKRKMSYHHWTLGNYQTELDSGNFQNVSMSDITAEVIRSFTSYRRWLKDLKRKKFFDDLILKIYYTAHSEINIYLLDHSRQYCVFTGSKPA